MSQELARLEAAWPQGLPEGVIHADLFPDNVFFEKGDVITGEQSGATATVDQIIDYLQNETEPVKRLKTNSNFRNEGDVLIDWDPNNPLGCAYVFLKSTRARSVPPNDKKLSRRRWLIVFKHGACSQKS